MLPTDVSGTQFIRELRHSKTHHIPYEIGRKLSLYLLKIQELLKAIEKTKTPGRLCCSSQQPEAECRELLLSKRDEFGFIFTMMSHKKTELHKAFPRKNIKSPKAFISEQLWNWN